MNLENYEKVLKNRAKIQKRGIHSFLHEVTWEVCQWVNEPREFGKWLGAIKRLGAGQMQSLLKELKKQGIKDPRYVFACTRTRSR